MNFLDIILIVVIVIILIGGFVIMISAVKDCEVGAGIGVFILALVLAGFVAVPFIVIDKASGGTTGTITSIDKNFFGTTALYIKTTETNEEEYCIEFDTELENKAKELIGKKVKITYGKRVGLYSTGQCSQAPVESIELVEE